MEGLGEWYINGSKYGPFDFFATEGCLQPYTSAYTPEHDGILQHIID